jgi:hypothetical protein
MDFIKKFLRLAPLKPSKGDFVPDKHARPGSRLPGLYVAIA